MGSLEESQKIIRFINQYRHPELYQNDVDWFIHTLDLNIKNSLEIHSKASTNGWRLLKLEKVIAYKEAGSYPLKDEQLEVIIQNLKTILAKQKGYKAGDFSYNTGQIVAKGSVEQIKKNENSITGPYL